MFDLYRANRNETCRFILGKSGVRPLFIVGLNPSTATRDKSDVTATKVERVAQANGYDGFVMTNLYPRRSTLPDNLPRRGDRRLIDRNVEMIVEQAKHQATPHFWAAWGADICKRRYLVSACQTLADKVADMGGSWWCFGPVADVGVTDIAVVEGPVTESSAITSPLTKAGHPRHPSRLSYAWALQGFDMPEYLDKIDRK